MDLKKFKNHILFANHSPGQCYFGTGNMIMIYFQKLTCINQSYLRFLQMPTADFNQIIWNNLMKIVFYNYLLFHIGYN